MLMTYEAYKMFEGKYSFFYNVDPFVKLSLHLNPCYLLDSSLNDIYVFTVFIL